MSLPYWIYRIRCRKAYIRFSPIFRLPMVSPKGPESCLTHNRCWAVYLSLSIHGGTSGWFYQVHWVFYSIQNQVSSASHELNWMLLDHQTIGQIISRNLWLIPFNIIKKNKPATLLMIYPAAKGFNVEPQIRHSGFGGGVTTKGWRDGFTGNGTEMMDLLDTYMNYDDIWDFCGYIHILVI